MVVLIVEVICFIVRVIFFIVRVTFFIVRVTFLKAVIFLFFPPILIIMKLIAFLHHKLIISHIRSYFSSLNEMNLIFLTNLIKNYLVFMKICILEYLLNLLQHVQMYCINYPNVQQYFLLIIVSLILIFLFQVKCIFFHMDFRKSLR